MNNRYANEQCPSSCRYPDEYLEPKLIDEQIISLAKFFELDPTHALGYATNLPALPPGSEEWFAAPTVDALAKRYFPQLSEPAERYCRAVNFILASMASKIDFYGFNNYLEGEIVPKLFRVYNHTAEAFAALAKKQKGDILVFPAQLGMLHRGRSVRRARELYLPNEFGLSTVAVGSILLNHPERVAMYWNMLLAFCAGDEAYCKDCKEEEKFFGVPCFGYNEYDAGLINVDTQECGAVTGFLV